MKNRIIRISAIVVFIVSTPLIPLERIFGYRNNPVSRIKQNFQIIMFSISLGHSKEVYLQPK